MRLTDSWRYIMNYMAATYAPQASRDSLLAHLLLPAISLRSCWPWRCHLELWHPASWQACLAPAGPIPDACPPCCSHS